MITVKSRKSFRGFQRSNTIDLFMLPGELVEDTCQSCRHLRRDFLVVGITFARLINHNENSRMARSILLCASCCAVYEKSLGVVLTKRGETFEKVFIALDKSWKQTRAPLS